MFDADDLASSGGPRQVAGNPGWIIVGVDGSAPAERALDFACGEAKLWGASLLLVHSWDYPYGGDIGPTAGVLAQIERAGASLLERTATHARVRCGPGVQVDTLLTQGNAAGTLLQRSAELPGPRLIVVGSRGRGGFASLLLGSVSHQVLHHASVPVALLPAAEEAAALPPIDRLVVGVDGSTESVRAVRWAASRAAREGNELLLLNVVHVPNLLNPWSLLTPPDAAEELAALGHQWCDEAAVTVAELAPGCVVRQRVIEGVPGKELLAATRAGDLLVIGAVGAGGAARVVMGRVTGHVVHRAQTPVIVIP